MAVVESSQLLVCTLVCIYENKIKMFALIAFVLLYHIYLGSFSLIFVFSV
jgi:hypothetical protein